MAERKPIKGITKERTEKLIAETLAKMPEKAQTKRAPHLGANEPTSSTCAGRMWRRDTGTSSSSSSSRSTKRR